MAKWIRFDEYQMTPDRKTKKFSVVNKDNGTMVGTISWYGPFRQYSFFPAANMVFEKTCLQDIADFLKKLMEDRKK